FLCPGRSDNCASDPGLTASWTRTADGAAGTLRWVWADGRKKEAATGPRLEDFVIELRPEGARIAAAGATLNGEIAAARPHAAFEIAVQATPPDEGAAAMLALKQIDIAQTRGPVDPAKPAAGVPALTSRAIFAGAPSDAWKPFAAHGGDFGKFARWQGGALIVDVPEKHYWGTTGVVSAAPALTIPRLSRRAPARIAVTLDPLRTRSGVILLNRAPTEDVWFQQVVWAQWSGRPDGGGRLLLSLCASPARLYDLETPPGWDGRMEIEISQEFAAVRLAPGWSVGGVAGCASEDLPLHVSALAQAGAEHAPASIVVSRIEIGRATPDGMTAMDRLEFLDAKEFKPDEFLDVVAGALDAAGAAAPQSDGAKP
ncbi:MAG: hypothetical protein JNK46_02540, partial [Methylobacteriaceae bacterium]|nr:hypothetical protein [Methylobacteriaceae bacterium]